MAEEMVDSFRAFTRVLSDVRRVISDDIFWGWDGRLQAAFMVIKDSDGHALNEALARSLSSRWDIESIQTAPAHVREVVDSLVGLRHRQYVYTSERDEAGRTLYAAYWPWANSELISIRVSLICPAGGRLSPDEEAELLNRTLGSNH